MLINKLDTEIEAFLLFKKFFLNFELSVDLNR